MMGILISVLASLVIVYLAGYHVAKRLYSKKPNVGGGLSNDEPSEESEAGKNH